ncbi:MAG: Ig-like domain-containing protein [Planctomycetota bacterium]|nr:Ig-like domain-containing protein [Planctomycetota bacterium]
MDRLVLVPALVLALGAPSNVVAAIGGVTVYVDAVNGSDLNSGSVRSPWQTITYALDQSDDAGTTISVATGTYDQALGEVFPLVLENASLVGPGDGSAEILAPDTDVSRVLYIDASSGLVQVVDGLSFGYEVVRGNPRHDLIRADLHGDFTLNNCYLTGGYNGFRGISRADGAHTTLSNNTISGSIKKGIYLAGYSDTGISLLVTGNSITGAGDDGIALSFGANWNASVIMSGTVLIDGNLISGVSGKGIQVDLDIFEYDNQTLDMDVTVSNNTISDVGDDGMQLGCLLDSSEVNLFDITLLVEDNAITTTGDDGIDAGMFMKSARNEALVDWEFRNNSVSGAVAEGIDLSLYVGDTSSSMVASVLIEGNTVVNSGDNGLEAALVVASGVSATLVVDMTVQNNTVEGSGFSGMWIGMPSVAYGSASSVDVNLMIDENTVTGSESSGMQVTFYNSSATSAALNTNYDVNVTNNTILGNDAETEMFLLGSTPSNIQVVVVGSSDLVPSMNGTGNWWGTQNQVDIAGMVIDASDLGAEFTALDHTSARPSDLEFVLTVSETQFTVEAIGLTRFVSYAGDTDMDITVGGISIGSGDIVSFSPQSITCTLPSGLVDVVEICVTNPGGQSGCHACSFGPNTAPHANFDAAFTPNSTPVTIDVVANDIDAECNLDPTSVVITQAPGQGSVVLNGDGTVTYTPNAATASDAFAYTVSDDGGLTSNNATVQVTVTGGGSGNNQIPTAVYDHVIMSSGTSITIDVLANDWDADMDALDGSSLEVRRQPRNGTVTVDNGELIFTPDSSGNSVFTYTVRDEHGALSNVATVAVWH